MEGISRNNIVLTCILVCLSLCSSGQGGYQWQSQLSGANGEGFYRVLLNPSITARCTNGYSDLRVVDSAGHYVPYLLQSETPATSTEVVGPFSFTTHTDSLFTIDIENTEARLCDELHLTLGNTAIGAQAAMTGSDDGRQWYEISDVVIHPGQAVRSETFEQTISMPPVKYRHLRLTMPMKKAIPLHVLSISASDAFVKEGKYTTIPAPHMMPQQDSVHTSFIKLVYDHRYVMDKVIFHVDGPRFYRRHLIVMDSRSVIDESTLSSDGDNTINLTGAYDTLTIQIDNEDNPPLRLRSVESLQLNRYAAMYLDGDRSYYLVGGNDKAQAPIYDLGYFQDSMRVHGIKDLATGPIVKNNITPLDEKVKPSEKKKPNTWWIWPTLAAVLALLLFFTFKMGKEVGAKKDI